MKKVTAFIGTASKKATYQAVQEFEQALKHYGDIDFETVFLSDYRLEFCLGCKQCFLKGEAYCPLQDDDRDVLLQKMEQSDGIVFATPTYAFGVAARMKNLFDRLAFLDHRPRFFGKACIAIVTQGFYGGRNVLTYLNFAGERMGFHVAQGCCLTTLDPLTPRQQQTLTQEMKKAAARFYRELLRPIPPPSLLQLWAFRFARTNVKSPLLDQTSPDYQYYQAKGWLESDYYYPTSLGVIKRLAGHLFDAFAQRQVKRQLRSVAAPL
jgi:multimeric flavodoxin WrbA